MTTIQSRLSAGISKLFDLAGTQIRVGYFTQSLGSIWDDDATLTQSGAYVWTSGIILPLNTTTGNYDSVLLEQGKIINGDSKIFLHGSLLLTGSEYQVRIQLGSPTGINYSVLNRNVRVEISNVPIYKRVYIRQLQSGSLFGE